MATSDEINRFLKRVTRDMDAPMALLVASEPTRQVVSQRGLDDVADMGRVLALDPVARGGFDRYPTGDTQLSYAHVSVHVTDRPVGSLFVADRRRRWFDDEEIRHLGLMASVAGPLIEDHLALDLAAVDLGAVDLGAVDVRDLPAPVADLLRLLR